MLDVRFQLSAFSVSAFSRSALNPHPSTFDTPLNPQLSTLNFSVMVIVCCCKELPRRPVGIARPARECQE